MPEALACNGTELGVQLFDEAEDDTVMVFPCAAADTEDRDTLADEA